MNRFVLYERVIEADDTAIICTAFHDQRLQSVKAKGCRRCRRVESYAFGDRVILKSRHAGLLDPKAACARAMRRI
jgi:hypothetical protein